MAIYWLLDRTTLAKYSNQRNEVIQSDIQGIVQGPGSALADLRSRPIVAPTRRPGRRGVMVRRVVWPGVPRLQCQHVPAAAALFMRHDLLRALARVTR
jgi:hypothetical protein